MSADKMKIVEKNISDLIEADYNPRELTDKQFNDLKASLTNFGLVDPILVNKNPERKNIIIGGHQRMKVWLEMGNKTIPCVELNLDLEKERELNVRLNKNTGQFNMDGLANFFEESDLIEWGFEAYEFGMGEAIDLEMPSEEELIDKEQKNNPIQITITFTDFEQLKLAEKEIDNMLKESYKGAFFNVKGGEI